MNLYTRGGDKGETSLFGGDRVAKDDPRITAYGEVDELNAVMGWSVAAIGAQAGASPAGAGGGGDSGVAAGAGSTRGSVTEIGEVVLRESSRLFTLGAQLATPPAARAGAGLPEWKADCSQQLENEIDRWSGELPPLKNFILPTGSELSCRLQIARTVCRRAERRLVALGCAEDSDFVVYLNRLSDWLFCLSRLANHRAGIAEHPWTAE
jgi:cob(I)alamin adenosyltransferase